MGGLLGGAIGLLPALVTFGLSIPFGVVIGGGCGLVAGGAAGGTAGLTGGGAAGFYAYTYRKDIHSAIARARAKANKFAVSVKARAMEFIGIQGKKTPQPITATKKDVNIREFRGTQ